VRLRRNKRLRPNDVRFLKSWSRRVKYAGRRTLGGLHPKIITYKIRNGLRPLAGTRQTGIDRAWRLEKQLVEQTGKGTHAWTREQAIELLETGKVRGFTGHHINNVQAFPAWAGDPRNIRFLSNRPRGGAHLRSNRGHRGNYQTPTSGRLMDRAAMVAAAARRGSR
jgi:hypothetical protein